MQQPPLPCNRRLHPSPLGPRRAVWAPNGRAEQWFLGGAMLGGARFDWTTTPPHSMPPTPCCSRKKGAYTIATVPLRRVCPS